MSETKPDVESSVPNNQELRGSNLEQTTVEELENAVYSPVITVTKEETSLTKGDLKVHKVVVSEDVSDDTMKMNRSTTIFKTQDTNDDSRVESNVYISVTSEQTSYYNVNEKGVNGNDLMMKKGSRKTRIPKRKFKQAVEKIKKEEEIIHERIIHDEPNIDIKVKSSIPRLKEMKESILKEKDDSQKLDDEFDKLYEEIKDNNVDVTISTPESLRDAEIVDSIFEEIIHAYDEKSEIKTEKVNINTENIENNNDKIEMTTEKVQISTAEKTNTEEEGNSSVNVETNTEKVKSKIPLLKRKSEQEIKIPLNRRRSLKKSISIDDTKIPIQTKLTAKIDLAKTKTDFQKSESCSTLGKLESASGNKFESIESKKVIKTIKSQKSIEMECSNVSTKELTSSNEVSKCKIPVKSNTKDKVEKLNSATLNKLPAKSNIIGKIVNQHTPSEASKSSIETHRISRNLIEKALRDHQEEKTDIKNNEKIEEKATNQQVLAQENQSVITTENKISQNGISVSESRLISSNEIQETSHSTNSRIVERSFTVTNTQWDNVTKKLDSSNENNYINVDLVSIKNSDEIKESINDNNMITEISKTDVESETIKTTQIKETIRVSTLAYDSSIDLKNEITNQNEIRDSEYNLNDSNTKVQAKEILSCAISKENQDEIKSDKKELVKSGKANNLQAIRTETIFIDIQKQDNTSKLESYEETENKTNIDIKTKSDNTNKPKFDSKEINNNKVIETKTYPSNKFDSLNSKLKTKSESKITNKVMTEMIANRIESITGSINKPDKSIKEYKVTTNTSLSTDNDKLKDSKETDSNKLNLRHNISSQTQNLDELNEEDIIILRGKVNRIISRLDSREVRIEKTEDDIPKNVSIVSKIAIFENNEPENRKNYLQNTTTNDNNEDDRPKIVDEILKSNENIDTDKSIPKDAIYNIYDDNKDKKFDYQTVFNKVHSSVLRRLKSLEMNSNINLKDIISQENLKDKVMNQKKANPNEEEEKEAKKVEVNISINEEEQRKTNRTDVNKKEIIKDEYNRTKSLAELHFESDGNRNTFDNKEKKKLQEDKRAKSLATLDFGNVMKGRVKEMVLRMNSIEQVNKEKRELERNRPRRLVLSKAAVFEKKVVPDKVENLSKPEKDRSNDTPLEIDQVNEEQLQERIAELNSAKAKYGKWKNMPTIELRDGSLMPVLAVGTALLEPKLIKHIIAAAIDLGYRAIDTAFIYGNEKEIGEAIRSKIEDGTVKREDLFIISKLWSTFHRRDLVEAACRQSLDTMGLKYFDLYMIHNPMSFREGSNPLPKIANVLQYSQYDYLEAWYGMESVVAKGLVKRVGLSNFNSAQVDRVMEKAKIKPVVNQVECHPYLTQHNLEDFCTTRNMKLSCFSVLGSKGTPKELKSATSAVLDDPLVQVMAAGLGVTPAQLLIAYQLHHGRNVVVKSSTGAHLWDNLRALDLKLDQTQVSALDALNKNKRTFTFKGMGDTHKNYPFKIAF